MCKRMLRVVIAQLALVLGVAACGGARDGMPPETGGGSGISRQFDEYPASLSIEGPSIVESGASITLQARADNNEYRGPAYLTYTAAQTLRVSSSPAELATPASVLLNLDQGDRNFLAADIEVTAPTVTAPRQFFVSVDNPRANAQRAVTVVPAGALYIRRLLLSRPVVEAGQTVTVEIELSQPAPSATDVQLAANFSLLELPVSVTVPANERTVTVDVRATESPGQEYVTVSATLNGLSQQASLWVRSAEAFVLKIELDRYYSVPNSATRQYDVPLRLSKPAGPAGLTITLTSNNGFVTVPASIRADPGVELVNVPFKVASFVGLSAVRITANGGGATRIGDALLGRDEGTPVIESLTLHRLRGGASGGLVPVGPCFDSNNRSHGNGIFGRANIVLDRIAPAGGFRVNLFARSSVLVLQQEFSIPEGTNAIGFDFEIPTGTASAQLRFVKVTARSVDTLQERSNTLLVGEGGGSALAELTTGSGSLGQARNFIPYFDWDPQPAAGGVLRGRVTLGEVDTNGNFVQAHAHGADEVPVHLSLIESGTPEVSRRVPTATLMIPALLGFADFELPLSPGAARQVVLLADAYSTDRTGTSLGPPSPCDLSYRRPIDLSAGGTLAFAGVTPRYVFGGEGGAVTVALREPAPPGGAVVELAPNAPASFITMPDQVIVPAGATTASVPFRTNPVAGFVTVDVLARYGNSTSARVEVMPEPTPLTMRFVPPTLSYGSTASLRIDLPHRYPVPLVASLGPTGGSADVRSSDVLNVPSTIVVPSRQLGVSVPIPVRPFGSGGQIPVTVLGAIRAAISEAHGEIASIHSWSDIGAPISVAGVAQMPSISRSFSLNSIRYPLTLASVDTDGGAQGRLFVRRFDPNVGTWSIVGPGALNPNSLTSAGQPSFLNPNGAPLVAFTQGNGVQQNIFAVRFDDFAGVWRNLSDLQARLNTVAGASRAVQPVLTALPWAARNGAATGLAFIEDDAVQFAWFDGAAWHYASPPTAIAGNARDVRFLRSSATGVVLLVWVDEGDSTYPIKGARLDLNGGGWTALPALAVPPAQPGSRRLEYFAASGEDRTVVWSQSTLPAQVMLAHYRDDTRTWAISRADAPADPAARLTALAFGSGSDVAYATDAGAGGRSVWIRRLVDSTNNWVNAVPPDAVAERVVGLSVGGGYFWQLTGRQVGVASVRQSQDGTQYTLQVRGIFAP